MFSVIHADGSRDSNPSVECLSTLYDEVLSAERDADVTVVHDDSGWSISADQTGRLVFEHVRKGGERHMICVQKERVLELWTRLIVGDLEGLLGERWRPGYAER